jgi:hypothetical protein
LTQGSYRALKTLEFNVSLEKPLNKEKGLEKPLKMGLKYPKRP